MHKAVVGTDPSGWPGHLCWDQPSCRLAPCSCAGACSCPATAVFESKQPSSSVLPAQEGPGPGLRAVGKRQESNRHTTVAAELSQVLWLVQQLCKVTCKHQPLHGVSWTAVYCQNIICFVLLRTEVLPWSLLQWSEGSCGGRGRGSGKKLQLFCLGDYQHSGDHFGHLREVDILLACVKGKYGPQITSAWVARLCMKREEALQHHLS